ncbi:MAG TPA: hypothetical protein VJ483_06890 [Holophagaceae bacterium]|nr:hypothetical protein [Holophagaceae bacterium]
MRQVCAWCNAEIAVLKGKGLREDAVSHGICPSCLQEVQRGLRAERRKVANNRSTTASGGHSPLS